MRSDFDLIFLAATGQRDLVVKIVADGIANGVNAFRVFTRCWNLFNLSGSIDGYWDASDFVVKTIFDAGGYMVPVILLDRFRKDGDKWVTLMDDAQADAWFEAWTERYKNWVNIIWSIVNEPEQPWQGYDGPTDARLLDFAKRLAAKLGHKDFIIGAAPDGDNPDASTSTINASVILARYANLIALHSSRMGGYQPEPGKEGRWRRWIDHLEGLVDVIDACRKVNRRAHGVHEEPPGHASRQEVPIPGGVYQREWEPEAALAGALTSILCGLTYCYHRIRSQDAGQPGLDLIGKCLRQIPAGWNYLNDSWGGSPSRGFDGPNGESKPQGKVRHFVRPGGGEARTLGYTNNGVPRVKWGNGYSPTEPPIYRGQKVAVWKSTTA